DLDVQREQQLADLKLQHVQQLQIPKQPIELHPEHRIQHLATQWERLHQAQKGRGVLWEKGDLGKFYSYQRGQPRPELDEPPEPSRASITIDEKQGGGSKTNLASLAAMQAQARAALRHSAGTPNDTPAWQAIVQMHRSAAKFEEDQLKRRKRR